MKLRRLQRAFTLIELLVVIAIIAIIAGMVGPTLLNFRKGDAMLAATRMMLDGVARARQLAISQHTTVYMVFMPTNFWADTAYPPVDPSNFSKADRDAVTNLLEKQLTGFAFVSLRSIADQPGQPVAKYLSTWQTLPDKAFIAQWKFNLGIYASNNIPDGNSSTLPQYQFQVTGFNTTTEIPFPRAETKPFTPGARHYVALPYIAFDYTGQLVSALPNADGEFIPLAHGSVAPAFDKVARRPVFGSPDVQEQPPGNSGPGTAYNLIHIDKFTGRARLEHQKVK
jgi:prepilin-type N-terminal cleavage/methylation domain-containing protein